MQRDLSKAGDCNEYSRTQGPIGDGKNSMFSKGKTGKGRFGGGGADLQINRQPENYNLPL
jgi:hypothetical protein